MLGYFLIGLNTPTWLLIFLTQASYEHLASMMMAQQRYGRRAFQDGGSAKKLAFLPQGTLLAERISGPTYERPQIQHGPVD